MPELWTEVGSSLTLRRKILLIGQAPSRTSQGKLPFSGQSGKRLADLAVIPQKDLKNYFKMINVFDYWPGRSGKGDAFPRDKIPDKLRKMVASYSATIFVGRGVADRFKFNPPEYLIWYSYPHRKQAASILPHPSGVNRWYNDPQNLKDAQMFLRGIIWLADLERRNA